MSNTLVAYFSATGRTKRIAERMAKAAEADLFEIVPAEPYTQQDLNWVDKTSRGTMEMNDDACRPAIASKVDNMDDYELVFLGFPVWWYIEPRIIDTFLESYDFSGKRIVPFATSTGSPIGEAPQHIQDVCPNAKVEEGHKFNTTDADPMLFQWVARYMH